VRWQKDKQQQAADKHAHTFVLSAGDQWCGIQLGSFFFSRVNDPCKLWRKGEPVVLLDPRYARETSPRVNQIVQVVHDMNRQSGT